MNSNINDILRELASGRMIVLVDDEDRENEGDLLLAASFANAESINFMASQARGLICLTLTGEHCKRLNLPMMSPENTSAYGTNFTVSIEAASGVTTGISAQDRAHTILTAASADACASDIVMPGHVFPLRADSGGVLVRAGHTEAGCDLARLAGLFPAAVICEIMNEDGTMARLDDLQQFASRHNLILGSIKNLIEHRLSNEVLIQRENQLSIQTAAGAFDLISFRDTASGHLHLAFCRGDINADTPVLTRVLVQPTFLDGVLTSLPERSWSTWEALQRIDAANHGVLIVLGVDVVDSDKVGLQLDSLASRPPSNTAGRLRTYGIGAQILRNLGAGRIRLLSSRMTIPNLDAFGLTIEEVIEK
ncbi:MAG: 3,4-dihydroxy-2-butanone-4-phosphate synthase [Gammaproteobacteria bacterium WSBS_2016_MAG_OTU1]